MLCKKSGNFYADKKGFTNYNLATKICAYKEKRTKQNVKRKRVGK